MWGSSLDTFVSFYLILFLDVVLAIFVLILFITDLDKVPVFSSCVGA